jgi:hypothetical protein
VNYYHLLLPGGWTERTHQPPDGSAHLGGGDAPPAVRVDALPARILTSLLGDYRATTRVL